MICLYLWMFLVSDVVAFVANFLAAVQDEDFSWEASSSSTRSVVLGVVGVGGVDIDFLAATGAVITMLDFSFNIQR